MVHRRRFVKIYPLKFCDIWRNVYFYRILDNENFKMDVKQTNFVTHLIITIQLYFTRQSKSFISVFFTCQVSACELQPFSCHDLANEIHSQTVKTVFSHLKQPSKILILKQTL